MGYQELDNAFIFSKRFPVVGVHQLGSPLDASRRRACRWDRET